MKNIIIIGAGLGGLSAACRLAKAGFSVTVLEKNEAVGGKVNFVESGGYKFDTGASLLTMRHVLEDLFEFCGKRVEDYLEIVPLEPICRYFWTDGAQFDASQNIERTEREIEKLAPEDALNFRTYLADSKQKYEIAERTFLAKSLNDLPKLLRTKYLPDLLKISTLKTLDKHNASYFKSAKLQQIFNRFATYNGSSPFETPATFALIPFVEFGLGAWYVRGGMYEIPRALERLAKELGVKIFTGAEVEKIVVENKKAVGVKVGGEIRNADTVISNADAVETYRNLLPVKKYQNREPSCSGFVLLLGTRKKFPQLAHHNIFFSDDYRAEFDALFKKKIPAPNPTIYICATSRTDETQSPEGHENLFVLVNAPYTNDKINWQTEGKSYRDLVIRKLENFGLEGLEDSIDFEQIITPEDFEKKYRANRGSIYGISSNGIFSAFLRVPNRSREIENLYFVGGATHPGGGIPLVLLSGKMAAESITN
ncbi:MAG TPA: phytoene desaturase family protein [Pyrinomonadaceae bacterium]|nr:phytoene desaturase family protein [Pyrinomonadaceae bacterium]